MEIDLAGAIKHRPSATDLAFLDDFENGRFKFKLGHRAHIQLAYIYLTEHGVRRATVRVRESIQNFFCYRRIDESQYHETLTRAWVLTVRHFMDETPPAESSDRFIEGNPQLLDSNFMLAHYSSHLLFSDRAREAFVAPDLQPLPEYDD